jgi:phosphatidate cytidylyltransferase
MASAEKRMGSAFSTLRSRTAVAAVGIPVVLGSLYYGGIALFIFVNIVQAVSLWELAGLSRKKGFTPLRMLPVCALVTLNADLTFRHGKDLLPIAMALFFMIAIVELFRGKPHSIANASVSVFSGVYLACFSFLIPLRNLPFPEAARVMTGGRLLWMLFTTVWVCDTAAYFFGVWFGSHRLFSRVSPKKTWEGAGAGFVFAVGFAWFFRVFWLPEISVSSAIWLGCIIGIFAQVGDLFESLLKRDAEVKDTANLLPGHGGMLDRFDSLIFLAPLVYWYFALTQV